MSRPDCPACGARLTADFLCPHDLGWCDRCGTSTPCDPECPGLLEKGTPAMTDRNHIPLFDAAAACAALIRALRDAIHSVQLLETTAVTWLHRLTWAERAAIKAAYDRGDIAAAQRLILDTIDKRQANPPT